MTDREKNPKDMYTSVSAITDADDCMRRWWFSKRCKLPQDQRKATIFGDVLHAVAERYLSADDRGIDPKTNRPVDLYPMGWETMKDRWSGSDTLYKVSNAEAALIKLLIQAAITEGVLIREPGRIVEKSIQTIIHTVGYANVILNGFIDLDTPRGVEDHKTAKIKKYLLSKAKLKKSIQMMGYAYERYLKKHKGNIWICHNGFVKDFDLPYVRKTEVELTEIEVKLFFNETILPIVKKMFRYYKDYPPEKLNAWRNIPPANNPNQSCNHHYGKPCPYITVCGGVCTIEQYLSKYGKTITDITGIVKPEVKGSKMNSLMDKIKKQNAEQAAGGTPPVVATQAQTAAATVIPETPTTTPPATGGLTAMIANMAAGVTATPPANTALPAAAEITAAPVVQPVAKVEKQTAPWYMYDKDGLACVACKDNPVLGFSTKMEPCMICVTRAREAGKPVPENFKVDVLEGGQLQFTPIGGGDATTTTVAPQPETKVDLQPVAGVAATAKPVVGSTLTSLLGTATAKAAEKIADTVIKEAENIVGKDKDEMAFDIFLGCAFAKKAANECVEIYADTLVRDMLNEISAIAKKPWSTIEHFALMQAVDAYADTLLPRLYGHAVITTIPSKGTAHARLIDGLRLHASSVITPLAG
jgi:hypothetical protein